MGAESAVVIVLVCAAGRDRAEAIVSGVGELDVDGGIDGQARRHLQCRGGGSMGNADPQTHARLSGVI